MPSIAKLSARNNTSVMTLYAWKRVADDEIAQGYSAPTADALFEAAGFGAVDTDKPVKGYLAVPVRLMNGKLVAIESAPANGVGNV
jgi:hypothetical protein